MNILRRLFCKHTTTVWLHQIGEQQSCRMPVRVCANCGQLLWAYYDKVSRKHTFQKPITLDLTK